MSSDEAATRTLAITEQIKPLLAGQSPEVQSAVLANLTALWLASHMGPDAETTAAYRRGLLDGHVQLVRDLIESSEAEILDGLVDRSVPQ